MAATKPYYQKAVMGADIFVNKKIYFLFNLKIDF